MLITFLGLAATGVAKAQINLAGQWAGTYHEDQPDRLPGPELGDYGGLPINAAARKRAEAWSASILSLPLYQCRVHPVDYAASFAQIRIWETVDPKTQQLIAIHVQHFAWNTIRTIWMDGRPHPPEYAQHTSMGFSTGEFVGRTLKVRTTHLKEGWLRRNGVPRSWHATLTEHFTRHDDVLTWHVYVDDPAYLEEPFFRNRDYFYSETARMGPYPCESVIETVLPEGYFPHYLPGENPFLVEFANNHGIPYPATVGGAASMYPDYVETIKEMAE
ncbi:MAG: hypothetical protein R3305_03500 [Gammaproteobacteria bacterium]|nr:hypothetical protein [Gammaproteobacteria bacterium]